MIMSQASWYERDGAIQAIPTQYAGTLFRSRTEARTAVMFDAFHIGWEYEPTRWILPSGKFRPDFRVSLIDSTVWWEVKPLEYREQPINPCWRELAQRSEMPVIVSFGLGTENPFEGEILPPLRLFGASKTDMDEIRELFSCDTMTEALRSARHWQF